MDIAERILAELRAQANPENLEGMARYGIATENALGVSVPFMRALARETRAGLKRDRAAWHELAAHLWSSGVHEARIMATFIDHPSQVDEAQMESWILDVDSWDLCDQLTNNLFRDSEFAWQKAVRWTERDEEFTKRSAFVLGATLAVHDKLADDAAFVGLLELAEREAGDERNLVKKAINWQIRQIGKRSAALNGVAIALCDRILELQPDSKAARWIARDALRELRSDAIRARLGLS
ncbi:MAG: DNA alkylation repair protein [Coriobacteriia bacterium]|nr:DNA alkylation repair protein [Coriobacteriia bacterium]